MVRRYPRRTPPSVTYAIETWPASRTVTVRLLADQTPRCERGPHTLSGMRR